MTDEQKYNTNPPFELTLLEPYKANPDFAGEDATLYNPRNPYNIFINYELGMHCVGFDVSYCCIIPPYNSIQAQAVKSGLKGERPRFLTPDDNVKLYYSVKDNSYSEGKQDEILAGAQGCEGNGNHGRPQRQYGKLRMDPSVYL